MNAPLHETQIGCYQQTYTGRKPIEITGESVVPDTMPDIGLIGETGGHLLLRAKRVQTSSCELEGELCAGVCYIPDGSDSLRVLEITVPWQAQFDSDQINSDGSCVGNVSIVQLEARLLNPRKVLVKAQLSVEVTCYEQVELTVCDDMEPDPEVQVRKEQMNCSLAATVCERSFVATDEYPLSGDLAGGEVLHSNVQFRTEDIKTLTNKLIVKGSVLSDVIVCAPGGTERVSFNSAFSFIAETDCETVSDDVKITILPTGLYYEVTADGKLAMEAHGVCQMVAFQPRELEYLSDAYSNFCETKPEYRPITVYCDTAARQQREVFSGEIPCRGQVAKVLFMTAAINQPVRDGQTVKVPVQLSACVKYESGVSDWLRKQETVSFHLEEREQMLSVRQTELHGMSSGNTVSYRLSLEAELRRETVMTVQTLSGVSLEGECGGSMQRPSLMVVRTGGSLWELARQYGSTVDLICRYNDIENEELADEKLLLIPKQHR